MRQYESRGVICGFLFETTRLCLALSTIATIIACCVTHLYCRIHFCIVHQQYWSFLR